MCTVPYWLSGTNVPKPKYPYCVAALLSRSFTPNVTVTGPAESFLQRDFGYLRVVDREDVVLED